MTRLKVSPGGQVYDVDLPEVKVTRDERSGYYVHGQGHFIHFDTLEEALAKKREIDSHRGLSGGW